MSTINAINHVSCSLQEAEEEETPQARVIDNYRAVRVTAGGLAAELPVPTAAQADFDITAEVKQRMIISTSVDCFDRRRPQRCGLV